MADWHFHISSAEMKNLAGQVEKNIVQRVSSRRKFEVTRALINRLEPYVPDGIKATAFGDRVEYGSIKGGAFTHYFWEGDVYGPNIYSKKYGRWFSPRGKLKHPTGRSLTFKKPTAIPHWTEAYPLIKDEFMYDVANILRK